MKDLKILDCTLRDGGRIFNCAFPNNDIIDITRGLEKAKIDIIELGFLRDQEKICYNGDSTFFTSIEQITPFIGKKNREVIYCAFIDFELFDFNTLTRHTDNSIDGLRVGFTKKSFLTRRKEIIKSLIHVQDLGYLLFIQGVNTPGYSDKELIELIELVNEVNPTGFGIVDTYGSLYEEDLKHIFSIADRNLKDSTWLDFHSHNNFQLSFSLAQKMISLCNDRRTLIIDTTLNGLGKCAGNLNTELILDFLVRKKHCDYELDIILDLIDDYIYEYRKKHNWGYSIPALLAGIYKTHPNNVIYLTEKMHMVTKDIRNVMSMIDEETRQRYDYDNIERLYAKYAAQKVEDDESIVLLQQAFLGKRVLVLAPGKTLTTYKDRIKQYIMERDDVVCISVNFNSDFGNDYIFFGNQRRYQKLRDGVDAPTIISSNITSIDISDIVVNYYGLINKGYYYFENSTMMLLNLLKRIGVSKIAIAGFDGFESDKGNFAEEGGYKDKRYETEYERINEDITRMFSDFILTMDGKAEIQILTPSRYVEKEGVICLGK